MYDEVYQRLARGWWFSPSTPVFSTNKNYRHYITEIVLKVVLNTITVINKKISARQLLYFVK
jgi:hypothetical protein